MIVCIRRHQTRTQDGGESQASEADVRAWCQKAKPIRGK